jgi:hypothetical protein
MTGIDCFLVEHQRQWYNRIGLRGGVSRWQPGRTDAYELKTGNQVNRDSEVERSLLRAEIPSSAAR